LKILAVITDAFGGYGGIARYNVDFLSALDSIESVSAIVALPRSGNVAETIQIGKICQLPPIHSRWRYLLGVLWVAFKFRPDMIFCGHVYHGPLARIVAAVLRCRLVSQLHGDEIWARLNRNLLAALERSAVVLCVSEHTREQYEAQVPYSDNAAVLHNTVGAQFVLGDRQAAREKFGIGDEYVLLTVARLDGRQGYKGHDRVLRALPKLAALDGKPLRYLIAGTGEDKSRLVMLAQELNVADQVDFLGAVAETDLPDLYRAADLFVMPSTGEGFGIVFIEAMASGTPALGLAVGGAPDALAHGELGDAVQLATFEASLAEIIARIPPDRSALSARTIARFGNDQFRHRVAELIESMN
jgi:phosphatidylinositol alpha-1,6-mannosyltransferase